MRKILLATILPLVTILITGCPNIDINIFPTDDRSFRVTTETFSENADLNVAIKREFGQSYELADWDDLLAYAKTHNMIQWANSIGMEQGDSYFVSRHGDRFWNGNRHFFITRHDHDTPSHFLVHDHINDHLIDLGSWYGINKHALAVKRE